MELKVIKGLATEMCTERYKRNVYETNRAFKAAALYTYLRNQTQSDTIHLFSSAHIKEAAAYYAEQLGISKASFYNYIRYAQELQLIDYNSKRIRLYSYKSICDRYLLNLEFTTIYHDPANNALEYTLKALEYQEAKERMQKGLDNKVRNNPTVKAAFAVEAARLGATEEVKFNPADLWQIQHYAFAAGGSETTYETLFIPNPDLNRNLFSMATARKMKSHVSAAYERSRLAKLKLLSVIERPPVQCNYTGTPNRGSTKGKLRNRRRRYESARKMAVWFLPHDVNVNPKLLYPECANPLPTPVV